MNVFALIPAVLTVAFAASALPAAAQQKLLPAQSSIAFEIKQMGVPVQGHFKKFDAQVNFDAAKLAASKVTFTVDIGSATLGAPEMDAELPKATWFNAAKFPQAQFTSISLQGAGRGQVRSGGQARHQGPEPRCDGARWPCHKTAPPPRQPACCRSNGFHSGSAKATGPTPRWWPMTCRSGSSSHLTGDPQAALIASIPHFSTLP